MDSKPEAKEHLEQVVDSQVEGLQPSPRDHLVLFYSQDAELIRCAGDYLLGALRDGGAAIVLGTWEHRLSLARFLVRAGVDVPAARSAGTYCELDAADTVGGIASDSHADPASFWAAITPVIRRAADAGQPVRIFGEMVAVLWDDGQPGAAIEVEAMWNELSAQFPFSLLCAYPTAAVTGRGQSDQLADLCRAHSAVSGDLAPAR